MSQLHQGQPNEKEAERLQRVERFLHSATFWEQSTPPPTDLCTRVADRIVGHSAHQNKRPTRLSLVSFGLIASGACTALALVVLLPDRVSQVPSSVVTGTTVQTVDTAVSVSTWAAPSVPYMAGTGMNNGITSGGKRQEHIEQVSLPETQPTQIAKTSRRKIALRRLAPQSLHLPRRPNQTFYALQPSPGNQAVSAVRQSEPRTLAEGPYTEETGGDDMVALVPVVLTEYRQDPNGDGSPESLQATYTPAVVALSIKQDARCETKSLPPTEAPISEAPPQPASPGQPR